MLLVSSKLRSSTDEYIISSRPTLISDGEGASSGSPHPTDNNTTTAMPQNNATNKSPAVRLHRASEADWHSVPPCPLFHHAGLRGFGGGSLSLFDFLFSRLSVEADVLFILISLSRVFRFPFFSVFLFSRLRFISSSYFDLFSRPCCVAFAPLLSSPATARETHAHAFPASPIGPARLFHIYSFHLISSPSP